MRHEDITKCLDIWLQVELTEAHTTVASVLATDPDGFYVAEMNGEVIGMCAGPMTREDTAFMGFYAVDPRYQGIGVGRELWSKTVSRLDDTKNIGLYGVPAMSEKYKKSGFKVEDPIRMLIYESYYESRGDEDVQTKHVVYPERLMDLHNSNLEVFRTPKSKWLVISDQLKTANFNEENLFNRLIEYDQAVNRFSRRKLLENYLLGDEVPLVAVMLKSTMQSDSTACVIGASGGAADEAASTEAGEQFQGQHCCGQLKDYSQSADKPDEETTLSSNIESNLTISSTDTSCCSTNDEAVYQILGYGCIRDDNTGGAMIGPLYADSDIYCEIILRQLIEKFPLRSGGKYSVMSLTSNSSAAQVLEKIGLRQIDQCSRMFTKFVPEASLSHIYFVHSPNFTLF